MSGKRLQTDCNRKQYCGYFKADSAQVPKTWQRKERLRIRFQSYEKQVRQFIFGLSNKTIKWYKCKINLGCFTLLACWLRVYRCFSVFRRRHRRKLFLCTWGLDCLLDVSEQVCVDEDYLPSSSPPGCRSCRTTTDKVRRSSRNAISRWSLTCVLSIFISLLTFSTFPWHVYLFIFIWIAQVLVVPAPLEAPTGVKRWWVDHRLQLSDVSLKSSGKIRGWEKCG